MSADVVKFAFIAGEISPTLWGRSDLTKYDLGMAEAYNFFVDYRGGLSSRPGFAFCEFVKDDDKKTRMVHFAFNPDIENTYIVLFGDEYIRFLQDGSYVLEDGIAFTSVTNGVVSSTAHGLTDGRWVKINGRSYEVSSVSTNALTLLTIPDGETASLTTGAGTMYPVYEIVSPYNEDELDGLSFEQYRDTLRITSKDDLPPYDLVRSDHTDWTIDETEISEYREGPTIISESLSDTGDAQTIFAVTSVYDDGSESAIGNLYKVDSMVNYPVTEGSVSIRWTPDPDAIEYKVYRSIVSVSESLSYGSELGYAGRTRGTKFTDPNIIPDFGQTPPTHYHPFKPGAITSIKVTAGGSGYSPTSSLTMSGGGSGFDGQVIVDDSGGIVNVLIKNGGSGYENPTLSVGTGSGATFEVEARPTSGTYPALSRIFQQRQIYAASWNNPITLWGSQYKRFDNFSSSDFVLDSDSFEFDLDTAAIAPIKHLLVTRGGMLAMTQDNVWLINGGGANEPLTPTNALADRQTYTGVSDLDPLPIDADILYVEGKGYAVRALSYNEISRVYAGEDKSILSNHLLGAGKEIIRWGYQESPFKTVWAVRSDGMLLAFTIVKAEDVYAWTPCGTKGRFLDLVVVREITEDRVYVTTQRYINGRWTKFIERMDLRQFVNVEDAWCVDAGLSLSGTYPDAEITIYQNDDEEWIVEASASVFTDSAGKILRAGNGIFAVSSVTSGTEAVLEVYKAPTNFIPETDDTRTFPVLSGNWTLDAKVTTLGGLWHLEGEEVSILGDGNVFPRQTVVDGTVTLPVGVTRAIVGLPYVCRGKTLPMIVPDAGIEAKRKRVVGIAARLTRSRGLQYGDAYDRTYEMKERTDEAWGQPTRLQEGIRYQYIGTTWDENGHTYFKLEDPLPVTLLSLVSDIEVGDEPD
jgi:hypothetical protein